MARQFMMILFLSSNIYPAIHSLNDFDIEKQKCYIANVPNVIRGQGPRLLTSNVTMKINETETLELYCQLNRALSHNEMIIWQFKSSNDGKTEVYSFGLMKVYNKRNFTVELLGKDSSIK